MGIWLPKYFSNISSVNPPTLLGSVATFELNWVGGLVNYIDDPTSIACVGGPPHTDGGIYLANDWVWCGGFIVFALSTNCAMARARILAIQRSTYS